MADRGGSDVTFEGGLESSSAAIRRAGEKLLKCFTNPQIKVVHVMGYHGVWRWRIVEYAVRMLKGSDLFDKQILVKLLRGDFNARRAQREIARQLGMNVDTSPDDDENLDNTEFILGARIFRSLMGQRFLLIAGDVTCDSDMESTGVSLRRKSRHDSKVVFVGDDMLQFKVSQSDQTIGLEVLSINMLREEAAEVAHSASVKGRFTPEAVLDCCFYLWFFFYAGFGAVRKGIEEFNVEWLTRNWIAEGFIIDEDEEDEEDDWTLEDKARSLLRELELRSLLKLSESKNGWVKPDWTFENDLKEALTDGKYWISESAPKKYGEWEHIHRMSLWRIDGDTFLPRAPPKCPKLLSLQLGVLHTLYSSVELDIPDSFFEQMHGLQVLHLYNLHIKYLPPSIACLLNLRLLRIYGCYHLKSFPSFFQALQKLEFLEVSKSFSFESMPDECFQQMTNLRFLLLDGTNIRSLPSSVSKLCTLRQLILINSSSLMEIPDESFESMQRLQVLDLSDDSNLESLPSSLSELVNLRRLKLSNCCSLKMKLLPHVKKLSTLEELNLCNCNSLEDIEDVSSSLGNILPKLVKLDLSGILAIRRLSLIGCQSLESVGLNGLTNLQVLRLSASKFKCFPENNMFGTDHLKHLDMLGMNHIREIKWDALGTELEYLNIHQCGTLNSSAENNEWPASIGGARIRVSNHRILQSLTPSLELWKAKCFTRFHICISPCQEDEPRRRFLYANIGSKIQTCNLPSPRNFDRYLEIQGGDTSPNDIDGVLSRTELFILYDNAFVQRLSHLGDVNEMTEMKECRVERCKRMEMFFEDENYNSEALSRLEKIWMSNLARLTSVCEGTYRSQSFTILKHMYLEFCPRLIVVFSSGVCLPSLETLQIKFCSRLEAVFRGVATEKGSLQRLHTICLWELPKLESICSGVCLPALTNLRVSGCRKLNKLPLRLPPDNAFAASTPIGRGLVEVEGELVWWDSLKLEGESTKRRVHFKERRPFRKC